MSQTFKKYERLCHKKVIESLFDRGNPLNKSFAVYPLRVIYQKTETEQLAPKVLFSVSKRSFKKAVDRNLLKRRLREAYRLHKSLVSNPQLSIVFLYTPRVETSYQEIEKAMVSILQRIQ